MDADVVDCAEAEGAFTYTCTLDIRGRRSTQPVEDAEVIVKTDMPSMPMAHNTRPAVATPVADHPGRYGVTLELEMHGEWSLAIDVDGKVGADAKRVRDRVVVKRHFGPSQGDSHAHRDHAPKKTHGHGGHGKSHAQ